MQYKVPQNVDIEDQVIGPLTLRQFIIILMGIGVMVVLNFILIGPLRIVFWLSSMLITAAVLGIAFAKYGDQNSESFLTGAIQTFTTPRKRVWKRVVEGQEVIEASPPKKAPEPVQKKSLDEVKDDLNRLAQFVDTGGSIGFDQKDRFLNFTPDKRIDTESNDLLEQAEKPHAIIDSVIEKIQKAVPKREPLISEVASVPPDQHFEYPEVSLKK